MGKLCPCEVSYNFFNIKWRAENMSTTSQASQRIAALLDENSFVEIGARVTARSTDFNLKQTETPSDGVITGYGVIGGNLV